MLFGKKERERRTRPDTRPPVADGWAGAEMRFFSIFDSMVTDGPTEGWTDGRTDKASYRVACPQLKMGEDRVYLFSRNHKTIKNLK